jgi:hypothetical protein
MAKLQQDMAQSNLVVEGSPLADVKGLYEQRKGMVKALLDLKEAIWAGSAPIRRLVIELSETKAAIALLQGLNTREQVQPVYGGGLAKYVASMKKEEVDAEVRRLEAQADKLQADINAFNYTHAINVEETTLALVG